ncbi:hypothetical protein TURU_102527 [Turdus rufiventris]|nr:hypothetical protein TURU_102527 [Turdus rufiventris]
MAVRDLGRGEGNDGPRSAEAAGMEGDMAVTGLARPGPMWPVDLVGPGFGRVCGKGIKGVVGEKQPEASPMSDRVNDSWLQDGPATGAKTKAIRNDNYASVRA